MVAIERLARPDGTVPGGQVSLPEMPPADRLRVEMRCARGAAGTDRVETIFEGFQHGSLGMRSMEFRAP
jgi:hypothetical protein